jgi:hypothetical protein
MTTEQRHYGPTAADVLADMLRRRGINADMDRLRDRVLADRDNRKARRGAHVEQVRQLGTAVHRARRRQEVAAEFQRIESTADTITELREAMRAGHEAESALREAVLHDEATYAAVLRETRP